MITYQQFCENCKQLQERVANACKMYGRDVSQVRILPVTKTHPVDAVEYATKYGFASVGENRVQEIVEKFDSPRGSALQIDWELIGHLQSAEYRESKALTLKNCLIKSTLKPKK